MFKLIIQDDEGKTTVVPLIRDELTIGRQEGNTIRLTERNVSRKHSRLLRSEETITIEDLNSYNGVRVNGSRIDGKVVVKETDRIQIGDYLIEIKADKPAAFAPTERMAPVNEDAIPEPLATGSSDVATAPTPILTPAPEDQTTELRAAIAPAVSGDPQTQDSQETPIEAARLVVLSTAMAGTEFELDRPSMVIGRTEENDLWVNHRSISRHHAKVVHDGDSYSIVDLQSANGVRVNGEDYGKVELRKGDVIDLGHVRFRFVAPGEDFLFGRDAQVVDISGSKKSKMGLWLLLLAVATGLAIYFATKSSSSKEPSQEQVKAIVFDASVPVHTAPEVTPDAAIAVPPVVSDDAALVPAINSEQLRELFEAAETGQAAEDWEAMAKAANEAIAIEPENARAKELVEKARFESKAAASMDAFNKAVGKSDWVQIAGRFAELPEESVYKARARVQHVEMKSRFEKRQMVAAQKLGSRGKCAEIRKLANQVPTPWKDVGNSIRKAPCKAAGSPTNPPDPQENVDPGVAAPTHEELLTQARKATRDTLFDKGLRLCQKALSLKPGHQDTLSTCAVAACGTRNAAAAKRYFSRVKSQQSQGILVDICSKKGISVR